MPTLGRACPREEPGGAIRVQNLDDSRRSAIHATYRASLRSSSTGNPRYPSLWVVCTWVGITGGFAPPAGRPLAPEGFGAAAACASLSLLATLAPEGFGWRRPRSWGPVRVDPHRDLWYDQPRERASFRSPSGVRGCSAVGRGFHTPTGIPGRRAPTLHRRRPTGSRRCPQLCRTASSCSRFPPDGQAFWRLDYVYVYVLYNI